MMSTDWSPPPPVKPLVLVVVLDLSTSVNLNQARSIVAGRCGELVRRVEGEWKSAGYPELSLYVLGTADGSRGDEPQDPIATWEPLTPRPVVSGKPSGMMLTQRPVEEVEERRDAEERHRQKKLAELRASCMRLRDGHRSAIYLTLHRALAALRQRCEQRPQECARPVLAIHSDMKENQQPALRRRVEQANREPPGHSDPGLSLWRPEGLTIRVCGLSQTDWDKTTEKRVRADVDYLAEAWRPVFGERIPMAAYCESARPSDGGL